MKIEFEAEDRELFIKEIIEGIKPLIASKCNCNNTGSKLMSADELTNYLGVSKDWIYNKTHLKEIPYIKVGQLIKFKKQDIDNWLAENKVPVV